MRKYFILNILFLLSASVLIAQPITTATPEYLLASAEEQLEAKHYNNALEKFSEVYKETRDRSLVYQIASLHHKLRDYAKAENWYGRIMKRDAELAKYPDVRYKYAQMLKYNGKYDEAIEQFMLVVSEEEDPKKIALAKTELKGARMVKDMKNIKGLTVEHAGNRINTRYSEYSPVLVGTDEMYFTAIQGKELIETSNTKKAYSKVYRSTKDPKKGWLKAAPLSDKINRDGFHIGNLALSPNGGTMFFTRATLDGDELMTSKLYYSKKSGNAWEGANEVKGINGDYIVKQPAVGELFGKEVLFFISNMEGGHGGFDLYYATYKGDGAYELPVNLGPTVNSAADEESPFYRDGTLYFSSNGHPGMGGFDIFESVWNGSEWSAPENIGKGFNSSVDDKYFSIDEEGYKGLLISNRAGTKSIKGKTCCNDIFEVNIAKVVLDLLATTFSEGNILKGATVQLIESSGETEQDVNTEGNDYSFGLKPNVSYTVIGTATGFYPDTVTFNTVGLDVSTTIEKKLDLKPVPPPPPPPKEPEYEVISIKEAIRLNNIYYDYDDDKILTDAEIDLNFLLGLLNKYSDMVIELGSHTDARGNDRYNQRLAQRRAESAKNWLLAKGIDPSRIVAVGYGEKEILNRCTNGIKCEDEEHRINRRTEFKIIAGPKTIEVKKERVLKKPKK